MKKIKLILIVIAMLCCNIVFSQQVTNKEAVDVALAMVKQVFDKDDITEKDVRKTYAKASDEGYILIYEIIFADKTKVFVSGNKACIPILGYVPSENVPEGGLLENYDKMPDGLKFFMDSYCEQIDFCHKNPTSVEYCTEWDILKNLDNTKGMENRNVSPLLSTQWGQSVSNDGYNKAYNYFIQACDSFYNCPVGCVATAMGQIMKYWNSPVNIPHKCYQYDWNNMPDQLIASNDSNYITQRNAVAQLLYDCAESVNMNYCNGSGSCYNQTSGASPYSVPLAFRKFGFSEAVLDFRSYYYYDQTEWDNKLKNSIDNGEPIMYFGYSHNYDTAHAFVCDGYEQVFWDNNAFHFNWGWNGLADGYFCTFSINPSVNSTIYNFTTDQIAVFNIHPTSCFQDIIMECNKTFSSIATYMSVVNKIENNYHTFAFTGCYAELTAGEEIFLTNGFSVNEGTEFQAYISPCGGSAKGEDAQYSEWYEEDTLEEITELPQSTKLILRPNPTTGLVHVNFADNHLSIRQVEVRNLLGTSVLETANPQGNTLDVSALPAGVYIVRIVTNNGKQEFAKLVKR